MAAPRPSPLARTLTVASVLAAGACGGLIGWAVVDLQCTGDCTVPRGVGALIGALLAAVGTALICVLAIQAMAEWHQQEGRRRVE
jgi:ABC-type Co2+ transport system permease subunit